VFVDTATKGDVIVHTFNTSELQSDYTLFVVAYTNENGDPVQLPNDGSSNGDNRTGSILDYIPNIAYGSMELVEDLSPQCTYTNYQAEVELSEQQIALISNETDLTRALSFNVSEMRENTFQRD
jgi:hypothetical protein